MRTTVIFDLDGVLVDSRAVFLSCVNYAFDKLGLPQRAPRGAAALHRPAVRATGSASCSASRPTRRSSRACIDGYRERYETASLTETTVAPGIPEALAALHGAPTRRRDLQAECVRRAAAGGDGPARRTSRSSPAPSSAPAPRTRRRRSAARCSSSARPARVMVGDRSFDILAAHAHGLPSIGVTWGIGTAEELAGRRRRPADRDARGAARDGGRPARPLVSAPCSRSSTFTSISLWLHISAAVVGLGATFALAVGFPLALRLGRHATCRSCTT